MELSATAYVVLGMLSDGARSGYEIKAAVDGSVRFFWAASYGQIYPELRKLSEAGLIEGTDAPRGGRKRTTYELTRSGRAELRRWLREPPETFEMREEGLLKLFFSDAVEPADAAATLRAMAAHRRGVAERLRTIEPKALSAESGYPLMVLRSGIEFSEWFASWCDEMEREVLDSAAAKASA